MKSWWSFSRLWVGASRDSVLTGASTRLRVRAKRSLTTARAHPRVRAPAVCGRGLHWGGQVVGSSGAVAQAVAALLLGAKE